MSAVDPKSPPDGESTRLKAWSAIRQKLERLLHSTDNRALDRYRVEVTSIIDTLDTVHRDTDGLRGRGHRGD